MGAPEILLQHRHGEKVHKHVRLNKKKTLFVIGSSREADLRLAGKGVSGCHVVLRYRAPHWYVCNVADAGTVTVNNQKIIESQVDDQTVIEILGHKISLFTREPEQNLFDGSVTELDPTKRPMHQVVIRKNGRVLETHLLPETESFKWFDGETEQVYSAPTSAKWTTNVSGRRVIEQRLVPAQETAELAKPELQRDLRTSLLLSLLLMISLVGSVFYLGKFSAPTAENLDRRSMDVIFNAKAIKLKRTESQNLRKLAKMKSGGTTPENVQNNASSHQPEEATSPQPTHTSTALTSLRKSGLGDLIGKIAKRANRQGTMVAAIGASPDTQNTGRALFSAGTTTTGGGGSAAKAGESFKLGGIATQGRAGGVKGFSAGTELAGGNVGAGSVLAMSDDGDTLIEGGLDKDVIAEVIKRNLGQIKYCYERQLSSNRDLYGKVLVKFTIGAEGSVSEQRVDGSTLKSAMVEGCILRRMADWKFPLPKGGTQVHVAYPFLFKALD